MIASAPSANTSFSDLLVKNPEDMAFECLAAQATRRQLQQAADHLAGYLKSLGIKRGDTICVWLPDGGVWLQLLFSFARLGVLMVPISTRFRQEEALHVVKTANPK